MNFTLTDLNKFGAEIKRLSDIQIKMVQTKQVTQMYNRAMSYTPVDTGELRMSAKADTNEMIMGYTKEYAPHVEYGHRTRSGGFVTGRKFLYRNVEAQRPIYTQDILQEIRRK